MTAKRAHWLFLPFLLSSCSEGEVAVLAEGAMVEWEPHGLSPDTRFVDIRDMAQSGGFLWVLDSSPPYLTRISLGSDEEVRVGRKGMGPGELLEPWAIQPNDDSTGILIWDFATNRVSEFSQDGSFVASETLSRAAGTSVRPGLREVSYADPFRIRAVAGGFVSVSFDRRVDHSWDVWHGELRLSSPTLDPKRSIVRLADFRTTSLDPPREWSPLPLWDSCESQLLIWAPEAGEVLWVDMDGDVVKRMPGPSRSAPLQLEDIQRYLEWMARLEIGPEYRSREIDFEVMARRSSDQFATLQPRLTDIRCEAAGVAWLRMFDTEDDPVGRGRDWLRISHDVAPVRARAPRGFNPILFSQGGLFGSLETGNGDQVVGWIPGSDGLPADSSR